MLSQMGLYLNPGEDAKVARVSKGKSMRWDSMQNGRNLSTEVRAMQVGTCGNSHPGLITSYKANKGRNVFDPLRDQLLKGPLMDGLLRDLEFKGR